MRKLTADPQEIRTLTSVVGVVCERLGLVDLNDRENCARQVFTLFSNGLTKREDLLQRMGVNS